MRLLQNPTNPCFILSYPVFLFVWLNFQLDKSEFGEQKGSDSHARIPDDSVELKEIGNQHQHPNVHTSHAYSAHGYLDTQLGL